ncbi:DeoR/GlpR family DNA-binding transcription regulator [Telmatospirillum sp.]|uniref:DeoR/GlpR family DNA-binding transcription regulator n=1 Tax=Telmatospirillum sp. TaxID=2079197 RepID=UPI002841CF43|nr:DeoR/GlpR family DNA-binding transcription regulator [Telmatospirillum sp.]MDR3435743.1 DeoR/GlpR family DNA-binding transcription regulator [Telmatospirillum sp.]
MPIDAHLPSLRRRTILKRLNDGHPVVATDLAIEFGVSEDAIRRDLRDFAAKGLCSRVYGGALPLSPASTPIAIRMHEAPDRKRALARAALPLLSPGQTVFLDSGSTNALLAAELPTDLNLTVVTNSVPIAGTLMGKPGITLFMIGGRIEPQTGGSVGARAASEVQRFRFDLCFLGTCALSVSGGLSGFEMDDVDFKRALLACSQATAVMVTTEKLETTAPHRIAPLAAIDHLIVEHDVSADLLAALGKTGIAVVAVSPPDAAR